MISPLICVTFPNVALTGSQRAIKSCYDDVVCPFVIHRAPERRGKKMATEKQHIMQLTGDEISKGFANARDLSGICKDAPNRPSSHELLNLGEFLRQK